MKKRYVIALDQGTTSSRAILFNEQGEIVGRKSRPLKQIYPKPGWVEHDPLEIWNGQLTALKEVLKEAGVLPEEISGIGITNQRETVVVWDKNTGKPVYNGIVWQCRRTSQLCDNLKNRGLEEIIRRKTGLVVDAYFSGTKIKWILDHVEGVRKRAEAGQLLAGTIDTWLVWNMTGGKVHITDYSNASRTMLYNIHRLEWDQDLLSELEIPKSMLPKVVSSIGQIAVTDPALLGESVMIGGVAGDQQAALFGQNCFDTGCAKNTYGTGCFILMNTGRIPVDSKNNLLTTIAWGLGNEVEYALEGSVFNAGSTIQWLRDEMKLVESAPQADLLAETVPDTGGVYIVPAFTGLGAPYWDMYARGTIVGITRGTRREHMIRATLESIAYQSREVLEAMELDSGFRLKELRVDGGASVSDFLMQFQADLLGVKVNRPAVTETTALGAAYLAGLGTGLWKNREEIQDRCEVQRVFVPNMSEITREEKYNKWKKAVQRSMHWEE